MKLNPAAFNRFLNHIGQDMVWRKSFLCPCRNENSGSALSDCPFCMGKGCYWGDGKEGRAGISGMDVQKQWFQFGQAETGDVVITIPGDTPLYDMGQFDRITLKNSTQPFSQVLKRGEEYLSFVPVSVDYVSWIEKGKMVHGNKPIIEQGKPKWISDEPPEGTVYTMGGRRHPEYFVYQDFPQDRAHHHGLRLPRKVVLRKFDLFGR